MEDLGKTIKYPIEVYRTEYDMKYSCAKEYQAQAYKTLKEIFGEGMVKNEWDSLTYDNHTHNHVSVYGPRTDIAVGPFNSYADLDIGNDETAIMKKHPLVQRLQERTGDCVVWNNFARCFIAIEIVFSGSSKNIAGDLLNAVSTGAIGIVVAHRDIYKKVSGVLNYFGRLQDFGRLSEQGLKNIMLFSDEDFLKFLWELKNPSKISRLSTRDCFRVSFRDGLLVKNFKIFTATNNCDPKLIPGEITRLRTYGFDVNELIARHDVVLRATRYTQLSSAAVFDIGEIVSKKNVRLMDIIDICVYQKYRNRGIGAKILKIFEEIALENRCQYLCATLGYDRPGEPIDLQKNFFEKNGFTVWQDKNAQFSGWVAKKLIK